MEGSLVKCLQHYFSDNSDGFGKKIEISEFKALTDEDKQDFREMLTNAGYDVNAA